MGTEDTTIGPEQSRVEELQRALLDWFAENPADLPWRRRREPYAVLVSEFMLQQTQRARVAPKFVEFLDRFPDLPSLAAASTADVIRAWAGLGYNGRAVRLQRLARELAASGRDLPAAIEDLCALPGIGEYTARAVACFGFGAQTSVVDTNVSRVLRRALCGEPYPKLRASTDAALAQAALPEGRAFEWNSALMDLGATVCLARTPRCERCPWETLCLARPAFAKPQAATEARPRRAAEASAAYRAGRANGGPPHAPFSSTTRYLRGRIVGALRDLASGEAMELSELSVAATGMALPPQDERVGPLVEDLVREGLVAARDTPDGRSVYALPE